MEKRNVYIVVAIVIVVALVIAVSNFTGQSVLGKCIDSDNGDDPMTAGTVSYEKSDLTYRDECYSRSNIGPEKYLKEYYCLDKIATRRYFCESGCLEDENGIGYCAEGVADLVSD